MMHSIVTMVRKAVRPLLSEQHESLEAWWQTRFERRLRPLLVALIGSDGLVRAGKGEAMLIGMAVAALTGRRYLGYIDADNYVPGAVHEYVKVYAAGLHLARNPYAMVRISWHSKPKLRDGRLFFSRRGRSSEITNAFLNRLVAEYSGFGTEVIATGNAGEHALSLELGLRMRLAGGFAVEPFEYVPEVQPRPAAHFENRSGDSVFDGAVQLRLLGFVTSNEPLAAPWPRLIISIGRRSVPMALAIKRLSGAYALHIQNPKVPARLFDLVAAPAHDNFEGPNVITTFGAVPVWVNT